MWTSAELDEKMRTMVFCPAPTEAEIEAAAIRKANEKELERLRVKYDKLLDKRVKMLFCYGITDKQLSADPTLRDQACSKLHRSKSWRGNEYEIEQTKRNIEYLESELKGE